MITTLAPTFVPNAVLIPADANWQDNDGQHADPDTCTLLYLDGDRTYAEIYTKEAWERSGKPSYFLQHDTYFLADENGEKTENILGHAHLSITTQARAQADAEEAADEAAGKVRDRIQLLPDMWCVKTDDTEYWDEEFRKEHKIKHIFGVYVFSKSTHCHLCEFTPSYELCFMGSQWDADLDDSDDELPDRIDEAVREGDTSTEEYSYMHVSDIDALLKTEIKEGFFPPEGQGGGGYRITGLVSVTVEDAIEEIREGTNNGDL